MQLRVEYLYDPESRNWCFVVPSLRIVGSAETREEAELCAIEAVEFTLEDDLDAPPPDGGEVGFLNVTVQR